MSHLIRTALLGAAVLGTLAGAAATTPSPLTLTAANLVVTQETRDGKKVEVLTDASKTQVVPGSVLSLTQTFKNVSKGALSSIVLNMKVDPATTFQRATCTVGGITTQYSTDGKTFAAAPLMKTVTVTENGKTVQKKVEVKPSEYTAVRWNIARLTAGQEGTCAIRVTVK
ncbi:MULTISPECIES: hypothetical protein [unclassified Deinococcus]|uniref:hypothetical protein n=1 Tax=unclassified Deinococcus TaxID=2623546 RepID=UPI001E4455A0|nr:MULTISPECIES: hypothetical protein [unclassified Deinococcus]MCD0166204.1 hypothetical protein [Deinococcus sp. 12RED42]MCD0170701.1 hypothetical protein [Deinococcus sp. 23YEL01]